MRKYSDTDIRGILPSIHVPTLVMHRSESGWVDARSPRYVAERIADALYVELPGADALPWIGSSDAVVEEIEGFVTGVRHVPDSDRVLSTVLFTDIVGSTERQAALGDRAWAHLMEQHHAVVRSALTRWRGTENDTAGDGFFAAFDGPARAIRCAVEIVQRVANLGIEVRAGLHSGECEIMDGKHSGLAVTIGARVAAMAGESEVLVTQTVKDLVAGSGLRFEPRGERALKGVPDTWRIYQASIGE